MTSANALLVGPAERLVALGTLAVRPLVYRGENGTGPFAPSTSAVEGLVVRSTTSRRAPLLHMTTNLYGFIGIEPGQHRIHIVDPQGRFLQRAIEVTVPDRRPLGAALARGASVLPPVDNPPLALAWLRPAPKAFHDSGLFGVVHDASGVPLPLAWIRVDTPDGRFVTHSDARGEYVVPLPFVRQPPPVDAMAPKPPVPITVRAHRLIASVPEGGGVLAIFPADFDGLVPKIPPDTGPFEAVYSTTAPDTRAVAFEVGTSVRLDLQPA